MLLLTCSQQQRIDCYHTEYPRETLENQNLPLTVARSPACQEEAVGQGLTLLTCFFFCKETTLGRWFKYYSYSFPNKSRTISFPRHKHRSHKWSLLGRGKSHPEDIQGKKHIRLSDTSVSDNLTCITYIITKQLYYFVLQSLQTSSK